MWKYPGKFHINRQSTQTKYFTKIETLLFELKFYKRHNIFSAIQDDFISVPNYYFLFLIFIGLLQMRETDGFILMEFSLTSVSRC